MFGWLAGRPALKTAIVALLALPLLFFGGGFFGSAEDYAIARVGGLEVPQAEFTARFEREIDDFRRESGGEPSRQTRAALQQRALSSVITGYLLRAAAREKSFTPADAEVLADIRALPDFQDEGGAFSPSLFRELVGDDVEFIRRVRESSALRTLTGIFAEGEFVSRESARRLAGFFHQRRTIDAVVFNYGVRADGIIIDENDALDYFEENRARYLAEEKAAARYAQFSLDQFASAEEISEDEIADAYDLYREERRANEQRRVSHILIADGGEADGGEKAQSLADEIAEDPSQFEARARENSDDAGSALQGGSLGFILHDDLPPSLADAAFAMTVGEIRGPIESDDGAHILRLDGVIVPDLKPLDEVRDEIARELRRTKATEEFGAVLAEARELAYIELDRLEPVAAALSVTIAGPISVSRDAENNPPPFDSEELTEALLSESSIARSENTEPIAIGDEVYIIARLHEYQPPRQRELDEVREEVEEAMKTARASQIALNEARTLMSEIAGGGSPAADWGESVTASLSDEEPPPPFTAADLQAAFSADLSEGLPAYTLSPGADSLKLIRVNSAEEAPPPTEEIDSVSQRLAASRAEITELGYLDYLYSEFEVEIFPVRLTLDSPEESEEADSESDY